MIVVSAIVINPTALRSNAIQEVSTGDNTGMVMSKVPVIILLCALWKRYRVDSPLLFVTQDYMSKLFKAVSHDYDENWLKHSLWSFRHRTTTGSKNVHITLRWSKCQCNNNEKAHIWLIDIGVVTYVIRDYPLNCGCIFMSGLENIANDGMIIVLFLIAKNQYW